MISVKSNLRSKCTIDDRRDERLNSLQGPGNKDVDFALENIISAHESLPLELGADAFHAFNHPDFLFAAPGPKNRTMPLLFGTPSFALRQLANHRVYAITAIVSMALGIAATAAVYSVLYGVLIDPTPTATPTTSPWSTSTTNRVVKEISRSPWPRSSSYARPSRSRT